MTHSVSEAREQRRQLLQQALADTVRQRIALRRLHQTDVAREAGVSRTFLQSILRADKGCSLFVFLELSHGLEADPRELLSDALNRRELLRTPRRSTPVPESAPVRLVREQAPMNEVTVNNVTFRIGDKVRVGHYIGELIQIDNEHRVHVDLGEDYDDGMNDGFAEVSPEHLVKIK